MITLMALFYITGTSGSGKSSVRERLIQLGYEAYDTDVSINDWHDRQTGQVVTFMPEPETPAKTTKWVREHDFLMSEPKIKQLAAAAKSHDIFICGHASNDVDLMSYFQEVFCLVLDEASTTQRVQSRANNSWGNDAEQLALLMKWHKQTQERYRQVGATMIDATLPVEEVVSQILEQI